MNRTVYLTNFCVKNTSLAPRVRRISTAAPVNGWARSVKSEEKLSDAETTSAKKDWMKVRYRGHHKEERKIWFYAHDEGMRTNADEARQISDLKMLKLKQSLVCKGFARETKPYDPPNDVEERIATCFEEVSSKRAPADLLNFPLTDHLFKFKFLTMCASRFDHEVPSSDLHRIKIVKDVVAYYGMSVRGTNSYDDLARHQDELPPNLYVLPEVKRFDPTDTSAFHKGVDAYPGLTDRITGIRAQKKYPSLRTQFKWPDI